MEPISLLSSVKTALAKSKGHWPKVARGADVDYFTVVRIGNGTTKFPRHDTIQKLADYFARAA